jgi:hypothetical protein
MLKRLALVISALCAIPAAAWVVIGHHGGGAAPGTVPQNTLQPQIIGTDFPAAGTTVSLTSDVGRWDNSPTSYSYNWHYIGGPSLGQASTLTLNTSNPGVIGSALELDVTATNAAGSSTQMSHWFGPIEASAPSAPVAMELSSPPALGSGTLPTEPVNYLQNGHAIFPGCDIPPASPNLSPTHVWYFDPINGKTQTAGATGHAGSPFKDVSAIFNTVTGYPSGGLFGHGKTIPPGDTIYLEPGDAGHPIGDIIGGGYSTSDGTASGTVAWTWIMGDPAAISRPVLHSVKGANGAGFIFKSFNVEQYREGGAVSWSGGISSPSFDVHFEDIRLSQWLGHSDDPWAPSHYPNTRGSSDGTIVSAAPTSKISQDAPNTVATAAKNATVLSVTSLPPVGDYVWSPGLYYISATVPATANGIPNGSKVVSEDAGAMTITIAPCDPVADAATGCPTTSYPGLSGSGHDNVPGCDPILSAAATGIRSGGCPAGTPPAWNGTTRALSGEKISFTDRLTVLPAGYWNSNDWEGGANAQVYLRGQLNAAGSVDPTNPNLLQGQKCMSVKDSIIRDGAVGIAALQATNTIFYNNKIKYVSVDFFELYTTNRIWVIHNYASEPTLLWGHQDFVQLGDSTGHVGIRYLYGNAIVENEAYQSTDTTNYFPKTMQGINTTENEHWGDYVCCNILVAGTNGININGKYDVVIHNNEFPLNVAVGNQPKNKAINNAEPTYSVLANNVANGIYRQNANDAQPSWCDPTTGDHVTVEGNISLPVVFDTGPTQINANIYCDNSGVQQFGGSQGFYPGLSVWTLTDWRSAVGGVSSLLTDYHPVAPPIKPAPGWIQALAGPLHLCINGSFPPGGTCQSGNFGVVDTHPNALFAGTTNNVVSTVKQIWNLPTTTVAGNAYYVTTAGCFSGATPPFCNPGVYQATTSTTITANIAGLTSAYAYISPTYNPGIIGAGTNLGAQQPIADIYGNAWANPPSSGAVEGNPTHLHYAAGLGAPAVITGTSTSMGYNLFDSSSKAACDALSAGNQCLLYLGDHTYDTTTQNIILSTANDPKVWGYYILDEPADADVPVTAQYVDFIHAHAPTKYSFFVAVNDNTPTSPTYYVTPSNTHMTTNMDLIGIDPYPVRPAVEGAEFSTGIDLAVINAGVAEALSVGWTQRQLVPVYQAFGGPSGTPYDHWTLPTAAQATQILSTFDALIPTPLFDYAYAWNQQQSDYPLGGAAGEPAGIQTQTIQLQQVYAAHNKNP